MQRTGFLSRFARILRNVILGFIAVSIFSVLIYRFLPPPVTPLMLIRVAEQAFDEDRDVRLRKDWVNINHMSPWFIRAAIASEDQNFELHSGFDWEAIDKARKYNKKHEGKKVRGASTITQQLAKNVFLWPGRNWLRKGLEVWFTFLIELIWDKERIIEVYLNVVEMGDGIYGVEAASKHYFSKSAQKVSKDQAVAIIACLPSPLRWSPVKPGKFVRWKKAWIVRQMNNAPAPSFLI